MRDPKAEQERFLLMMQELIEQTGKDTEADNQNQGEEK